MKQVKERGLPEQLDQNERKKQEALFEIMTSEASYLRSLDVLIDCFMTSAELDFQNTSSVINRRDHQVLFSNITSVRNVSKRWVTNQ